MLLIPRRSKRSRRLSGNSAKVEQRLLWRKLQFWHFYGYPANSFASSHRLSTIMNADRIMVITGGELVEEGSHEELIVANGKYAELWSKQIFVKTKDANSKDDEPAAKDDKGVDIVNDLPSEVAKVELAKVKPAAGSSTDDPASGESSGSEDSEDSTDTLVTPGHRKEV